MRIVWAVPALALLAACQPAPNAAVVVPTPGPAPGAVVAPVYVPPPPAPAPVVEQPYTPPPGSLAYSHYRRHRHRCHYVNGHCRPFETTVYKKPVHKKHKKQPHS